MDKKKLRQDNAGISLVELIAAVSIFVILALVLFRSFVLSSSVNRKTSNYQEAMNIAQNIMEEVQAKSFSKVAAAFNYPLNLVTNSSQFSFLDGQEDTVKIKEIIKSDVGFDDVRRYEESNGDTSKVTSSILSTNGGKTYTFLPRKKGKNASKYYFSMEGIKEQKNTFDALVEFDGSKDSGYKREENSTNQEEKNDYLMPNIATLDTKKNAFLIMGKDWDKNAMQTMIKEQNTKARQNWINDKYPDAGNQDGSNNVNNPEQNLQDGPQELNYDKVYEQTKRILEVKVSKENGITKAEARYTLYAYNYHNGDDPYETMSICPCGGKNLGKNDGDSDWISGCFCTYVSPWTVFYSSEAGESLEGAYIFYYPNYHSKSSVNPLDEIVVDNTANLKFHLYVTKQRDDDTSLTTQEEGGYKMSLTIGETPSERGNSNWNTNLGLYRSQIILRSNLDYDMSQTNVNERPKLNQMKLTYQEKLEGGAVKKASGNSAKTVLDLNSLDAKEAYDRIYKIKVTVYKGGAGQKGFAKEDKILSLDGSKEN